MYESGDNIRDLAKCQAVAASESAKIWGMASVRERICELGRRAYAHGLVSSTEGNFSARLDGGEIICTPSGVCKGELDADELCIVDLDGQQRSGARRISSEIHLHLAMYRANARVGAVIHTHPPFATTFAVLGEAPPTGLLAEAEIFLGTVPALAYAEPGTAAVGDAVAPLANSHVAAILRNHGVVTWGRDLDQAYNFSESLEAVCRVAYQARLIGEPHRIPAEALGALARRRMREWGQSDNR